MRCSEHAVVQAEKPRSGCEVCTLLNRIKAGEFDTVLEDILAAGHGRKRARRGRR